MPYLLHCTGFTLLLTAVVGLSSIEPARQLSKPTKETKWTQSDSYIFTPPGFRKEGKPITASEQNTGKLEIRVREQTTGKPVFCRIAVVGPDGNFYQPPPSYLSQYSLTGQWPQKGSWGNRPGKAPYRYVGRFFYSWGDVTVNVQPGIARVEVWKGFEYRPESKKVEVTAGQTTKTEIELTKTVSMPSQNYYSGDLHIHIPRETERDEQTILDLLEAEDMHYGAILGYNEPAGPYVGLMNKQSSPQYRGLGIHSERKRGAYHILSGQEYRSKTYGHLNLYLRDELILTGKSVNADNWPVYGNIGKETRAKGGYAIHAHGGYAQEIYADAAQGAVDAVELLQFGIYRGLGREDWYHILNAGYRFPCTGSSDYPACRWFGDCRMYVYCEAHPDFAEWLRGAVAGRSFVTTGPLLLLEADGHEPGATIQIDQHSPAKVRTITARVRVRSEVTPVTHLAVIVNGETIARKTVKAKDGLGEWLELEAPIEVKDSCWIAARAYSKSIDDKPDAEAHTNPVYVYVNGKRPYNKDSIDAWIARIDKQIAVHTKRSFPEKSKVLDYFQRSRNLLLRIRGEGGLAADADPMKMAKELEAPGPAVGSGP
jgi:hypothetical protein